MTRPEALISRVLKARYYPNCHLLEAIRTSGASYTWSDIWEVKEEMNKGLRWVLGDGKTINTATDHWLRGKGSFCVNQDEISSAVLNTKVCDFFWEDRKTCDVVKINQYFNNEDANAILNTRIPQVSTQDMIAWVHSKDGQYTVKSGYQQWYIHHVETPGM